MAEPEPGIDAVNHTDRLIDALAEGAPMPPSDPLAAMLAEWRDEIRTQPPAQAVSLAQAAAALGGSQRRRRRTRVGLTVLGAVAASLLTLGGLGAVVYDAAPGEALYGLRTMLFGELPAARDEQVALAAQTQLAEVQELIDDGAWEQAQTKLAAISTTVQTVQDLERKQDLVQQWNQLTVKVIEQDPAATLAPGAPAPVLPGLSPTVSVPLPGATEPATTTSTDTTDATEPATTAPTGTSPTPTPTGTGEREVPSAPTTPSPVPTTPSPTGAAASPTTPTTTTRPTPTTTTTAAPTSEPAATTTSAPVQVTPSAPAPAEPTGSAAAPTTTTEPAVAEPSPESADEPPATTPASPVTTTTPPPATRAPSTQQQPSAPARSGAQPASPGDGG